MESKTRRGREVKIKKAVEIFRDLLEESRLGDGSMCNRPISIGRKIREWHDSRKKRV